MTSTFTHGTHQVSICGRMVTLTGWWLITGESKTWLGANIAGALQNVSI